jgi:hypothetical protein
MDYYVKATTMTLTEKRQTVFPLDWCRREGLERGGPLNVFDLGKDGLLIRPVKAPGKRAISKLLKQISASRHSAGQAATIVNQAMEEMRAAFAGVDCSGAKGEPTAKDRAFIGKLIQGHRSGKRRA